MRKRATTGQLRLPHSDSELPLFETTRPAPVKIIEIGGEGLKITLTGVPFANGTWNYLVTGDEGTLAHFLDDWKPGDLKFSGAVVYTWQEALSKLDEYPWIQLHPLTVQQDFARAVRDAVVARLQTPGVKDGGEWRSRDDWDRVLLAVGAPLPA